MIFYWYLKELFFLTSNKAEFKNLYDSEVLNRDFSSLRTSTDFIGLCNLTGLYSFKNMISPKNILILMVGSSLAPKWQILSHLCKMDHQKSNFLLISDLLSVGGCWGQQMLLFKKKLLWNPKIPYLSITELSLNQI